MAMRICTYVWVQINVQLQAEVPSVLTARCICASMELYSPGDIIRLQAVVDLCRNERSAAKDQMKENESR